MSHHDTSTCENCSTALQGGYCHVCGQRAHNPLRDFRHAVEDVFESLWHLDGRIFRTVRELFIPGRVAANYLAGHRVRYIAPLRLFVILTVLAFFVGKLTLHLPTGGVVVDETTGANVGFSAGAGDADGPSAFATAKTRDEVLAAYARRVDELAFEASQGDGALFIGPLQSTIRKDLDAQAVRRLVQLGLDESAARAALARADAGRAAKPAAAATGTPPAPVKIDAGDGEGLFGGWLKARGERLQANLARINESPDEFVRMFMGAVPGALFLMVPVFALFLRVLYLRTRRGYLEHLVVALYSHAFMVAALLLIFLMEGVKAWVGDQGPLAIAARTVNGLLMFGIPVYLFWMQKRVYGQGWLVTTLKYVILGGVYSILLGLALAYAALAGLTS
jgi:hypothetical protein